MTIFMHEKGLACKHLGNKELQGRIQKNPYLSALSQVAELWFVVSNLLLSFDYQF